MGKLFSLSEGYRLIIFFLLGVYIYMALSMNALILKSELKMRPNSKISLRNLATRVLLREISI